VHISLKIFSHGEFMGSLFRQLLEKHAALCTFGLCGAVGFLVDTDHIIKFLFVPEASGRILHIPILLACCFVLCGLGAYVGGLYLKHILKQK
jgi:hypothetical protein